MDKETSTQELRALAEVAIAQRDRPGVGPTVFPRATLVDCDGPGRSLTVSYMPEPWMENTMGVVHGGMISSMLDSSMGMTGYCFTERPTPTISLTVNYCRPVPLDKPVYVRTRAAVCGRTSLQCMAEMYHPDRPELVLSYATGIFHILKKRYSEFYSERNAAD